MKYLDDFSLKRIFDFSYVVELTGNKDLASNTIQNYLDKGYIKRVKKNLYVTISLENDGVIPTKFEIASNITDSSYVSYHSAFEFYGYLNQVSNEIMVSSKEQFRPFEFGYNQYVCRRVDDDKFVENVNGVKVSSLAKTIVDSIDDVKTYDDLEELLEVLSMIPVIGGKEILEYLKVIDKKILYSKTGLILSLYEDGINITADLLGEIKKLGVKKVKNFTGEINRLSKYYKEWKLHCYNLSKFNMEKLDDKL